MRPPPCQYCYITLLNRPNRTRQRETLKQLASFFVPFPRKLNVLQITLFSRTRFFPSAQEAVPQPHKTDSTAEMRAFWNAAQPTRQSTSYSLQCEPRISPGNISVISLLVKRSCVTSKMTGPQRRKRLHLSGTTTRYGKLTSNVLPIGLSPFYLSPKMYLQLLKESTNDIIFFILSTNILLSPQFSKTFSTFQTIRATAQLSHEFKFLSKTNFADPIQRIHAQDTTNKEEEEIQFLLSL